MPISVKHKSVGNELTRAEWEDAATHEVSGKANAEQLQDRGISTAAPSDGYALVWVAAQALWVPADVLTPAEHSGITATPHVTDAEKTAWNNKLASVVEDTAPQLGGDLDAQNHAITALLKTVFKDFVEVTIATGAITATQMCHTVDTEGGASTDDLDTINGGTTGQLVVLRAANDARTVVVKHNTGNIWLQGKQDINLDDLEDGLLLVFDGTKWFDIAAGGGGGGSSTFLGLTDTPSSYSGKAGQLPKVNSAESALEFAKRGWEVIYDSLLATAATEVQITGLDGDSDIWYMILLFIVSDASAAANYLIEFNGDATAANYKCQFIWTESTNINTGFYTNYEGWILFAIDPAKRGQAIGFTHVKSGEIRAYYSLGNRDKGDTAQAFNMCAGNWLNTAANLTSFHIIATQTNGLGVDTRIILLKKAG